MLKEILKPHRGRFALATGLSAFSALLSILVLSGINQLATEQQISTASLIKVLLLVVGMFVISFISQCVLSHTGTRAVASLRASLSEKFLNQDYEDTLAIGKSQISGSLISDVTRIASMLLMAPLLVFNLLVLLFCICYLATISLPLLSVLAVFLLLAILSSALILGKAQKYFGMMRDEEDHLFEGFRAIAEAKRELTANEARKQHFLSQVISPSIESTREKDFKAQIWWNFSGSWSTTMIFFGLLSIIYVGAFQLALASEILLQFVIVTLYMTGPIAFIVNSNQVIGRGMTSITKLKRLKITTTEQAPVALPVKQNWQQIRLEHVSYGYKSEDNNFSLGPVDLTLNRGHCYFLVGGNGSGKSTLAHILTGLLRADSGQIYVDAMEITPAIKASYRELFSSIFFDFYVFDDLLDHEGQTVADLVADTWLQKMKLEKKVSVAGGKFSSTHFSQGQRKRLALIQSYLQGKDILLFDEWAADQDPQFKDYFYHQLLPQLKQQGKTLIVISHDDRYFHLADRVIKLDSGQLVTPESMNMDVMNEQVV